MVRKETTMNPFARFAFFTMVRDTSFVALAAGTLMVGYSFEPPLAFTIGATVALIFSIGLLVRSYFLTEERLLRSEVWRALSGASTLLADCGKICIAVSEDIDPNNADADTLMQIAGVDQAAADALIAARPFASAKIRSAVRPS